MVCSEYDVLISGYVDEELSEEESRRLREHLKICGECRKELERARTIKKSLDMAAIRTPEDDFWDGYWAGIYNRLERNTGWIFLIIGMLIMACGGVSMIMRDFLFASETPLWAAVGCIFLTFGLMVMTVSLIRERIRVNKHERYKDVRR